MTSTNQTSSTDHVYLRATPNNFDTEALVDTMQLAHYWDLQDFFQQVQQLLVEHMALWNYEYRESHLSHLRISTV
jgi:alpha-D-ribose 1-methylphosphonate 5-triphosphate synthase subunit PhnI